MGIAYARWLKRDCKCLPAFARAVSMTSFLLSNSILTCVNELPVTAAVSTLPTKRNGNQAKERNNQHRAVQQYLFIHWSYPRFR